MSAWMGQLPITVSLRRLFPSASFVGCADILTSDATERSDECGPQTLFAALPGTQFDGTEFVPDAVERGAVGLLAERPMANAPVPQCIVPNVRRSYAQLCSRLVADPSERLDVVGVTGTNGKTTVTWLIRSILSAVGKSVGLLGTIEYSDGKNSVSAGLTTPDSKMLSQWLAAMVRVKTSVAAIEMSSHALQQDRAAGTSLRAAVVTNITQDHFDYHNDYATYSAAKSRIVESCRSGGALIVNADDPGSLSVLNRNGRDIAVTTYGLVHDADVKATILEESLAGTRFVLHNGDDSITVWTPLVGRHNVSNCLAAASVAYQLGATSKQIADGIGALGGIPGRMERIISRQPYHVFVDYAHTDDALGRCVSQLRHLTHGRVICVFGAGGDRDRSKRSLLARAASQSHIAVVTSDNPRSEDPQQIIQDIVSGFQPNDRCEIHTDPDRESAIQWAVRHAEPGDTVLIAGKGHESEQIIGNRAIPFDDREVVRNALDHYAVRRQPMRIRTGIS